MRILSVRVFMFGLILICFSISCGSKDGSAESAARSIQFSEAEGSPFMAGNSPRSIAVEDLNGDKRVDLTIANHDTNNITVLLGNGKGGFSVGDVIPTGSNQAVCVSFGDFDIDGKADLAVAHFTGGAISILMGNGKGGFSSPGNPYYAKGWWLRSVAAGHVNDDGKLDLIATAVGDFISEMNTGVKHNDGVVVLLGNGTGEFTSDPNLSFTTQRGPTSIVMGDFNGDGKMDLATANEGSDNVTVLLGDGTGRFLADTVSSFKAGSDPFSLAVGDFNNDNKLDFAIANRKSNDLTVLLGDGKGQFFEASGSPFAVGTEPFSVLTGDFNRDGKLDLVTANKGSDNVTVLLGDGTGMFTPVPNSPYSVGSDPESVRLGDFNNDGWMDLAIANFKSNNVTVLLNSSSTLK